MPLSVLLLIGNVRKAPLVQWQIPAPFEKDVIQIIASVVESEVCFF